MTIVKSYRWGGTTRSKTVLVDPDSKPLTVEEVGKSINDYFWCRRKVSEGTKGPIVYAYTYAPPNHPFVSWPPAKNSLAADPPYPFR